MSVMGGEAGGMMQGQKGKQTSSRDVTMPHWLEPFVRQATRTGSGALYDLQDLYEGDTVADLTPDQLAGLDAMRGLTDSDFFNVAQDQFLQTAQGDAQYMDPALRDALMGGDFDLASFIGQARDATDFTQSDIARQALEGTAGGDYLYGGEAFQRAVDSAVNAATPRVASAFGGSVGGAGGSGLGRHAIGQSAIDAFAGQYGDERDRMLRAAGILDAGGRADRGTFLDFAGQEMSRGQRGREVLAGLDDRERDRQMAAAAALPDIGMLDANTRMQIGEYLQGQQQREIDAPIQNQLNLLMAALGIPGAYSPYLGDRGTQRTRNFGWGTYGSAKFG